MKKDDLIKLYWILDAVHKGSEPNRKHVADCFISIRDELMMPDTEELVAHIHEALGQSQVAADLLTEQAIGKSMRKALADRQLIELMRSVAEAQHAPADLCAGIAVAFGRLVEAAHGIRK